MRLFIVLAAVDESSLVGLVAGGVNVTAWPIFSSGIFGPLNEDFRKDQTFLMPILRQFNAGNLPKSFV